jgi:hypothetical protein
MKNAATLGGGRCADARNELAELTQSNASARISQAPEHWPGQIVIDPWGRIDLVTRGIPATMIAVRDAGDPIDIACFASTSPELPYTLRGEGALLGYQHFDHALSSSSRLRLHESVQDWVDAGGDGCAVVDWHLAVGLLVQVKEISCVDRYHAALVQEHLKPAGPPQPKLFVRRAS